MASAMERKIKGANALLPLKAKETSVPAPVLLLVVEDDALIQEMLETALTDGGFELIHAADGTQALAELATDAARFRAVITDIKFPAGPDGWSVARRAREIVPDMPVVYMSGDSADDWTSRGVPNSVMVAKPFAPAQIITAVATLLNATDIHRAAPPS
jgi:DNA-binding response OmpR family regulator